MCTQISHILIPRGPSIQKQTKLTDVWKGTNQNKCTLLKKIGSGVDKCAKSSLELAEKVVIRRRNLYEGETLSWPPGRTAISDL